MMKCPSCESEEVRRSHCRGWERILRRLILRKMFRCWACGRRFGRVLLEPHEDILIIIIWGGIVLLGILLILLKKGWFL